MKYSFTVKFVFRLWHVTLIDVSRAYSDLIQCVHVIYLYFTLLSLLWLRLKRNIFFCSWSSVVSSAKSPEGCKNLIRISSGPWVLINGLLKLCPKIGSQIQNYKLIPTWTPCQRFVSLRTPLLWFLTLRIQGMLLLRRSLHISQVLQELPFPILQKDASISTDVVWLPVPKAWHSLFHRGGLGSTCR